MTELISCFSSSWPNTNHSGPAISWQPGMVRDAIPSTAGPGGAPGGPRGSMRGPCSHIMRICSLHYPKKCPYGRVQLFKLRQTGLCSLSRSSTYCTRKVFPLSCAQIIALHPPLSPLLMYHHNLFASAFTGLQRQKVWNLSVKWTWGLMTHIYK